MGKHHPRQPGRHLVMCVYLAFVHDRYRGNVEEIGRIWTFWPQRQKPLAILSSTMKLTETYFVLDTHLEMREPIRGDTTHFPLIQMLIKFVCPDLFSGTCFSSSSCFIVRV